MSLAYCYYCLERADACECKQCDGDCNEYVYGTHRVSYLRGYRDCKAGKEENV